MDKATYHAACSDCLSWLKHVISVQFEMSVHQSICRLDSAKHVFVVRTQEEGVIKLHPGELTALTRR